MPLRSTPPSLIHGRILLVDGNPSGLAARRTVLEENGHKVSTAAGVTEALELFANHKFDLIVTDHKMPHMNGLGLIRKIHAAAPETPVVLLSGFVDVLGLNEQTTGAAAVIQKSANEVPHLVRAVTRLLKRVPAAKKGPAGEPPKSRAKRTGS